MEEEVLGGIGTGGEWESRAGLGGDIKRCQGCGEGGEGTTAQRDTGGRRDGRSDGEHKSEVHTVGGGTEETVPQVTNGGFETY